MLPKEYFGSFDLILVDLSETVMVREAGAQRHRADLLLRNSTHIAVIVVL